MDADSLPLILVIQLGQVHRPIMNLVRVGNTKRHLLQVQQHGLVQLSKQLKMFSQLTSKHYGLLHRLAIVSITGYRQTMVPIGLLLNQTRRSTSNILEKNLCGRRPSSVQPLYPGGSIWNTLLSMNRVEHGFHHLVQRVRKSARYVLFGWQRPILRPRLLFRFRTMMDKRGNQPTTLSKPVSQPKVQAMYSATLSP